MRVVRVYHAGRDRTHRARDRALVAAGVDVTLVVPSAWPGDGDEPDLSDEPFAVVELDVKRAGDVNRHGYRADLGTVVRRLAPDVLDIHEEPVSVATHQWLAAAPRELPVVMYTAQNVDKRFPPPFASYERRAYRRATAIYPCTRQAAAVVRGKGFTGSIEVLPLGYDGTVFRAGEQSPASAEIVLVLAGRLVPEKGVCDAIRVLARISEARPARLVVSGSGPEEAPARRLAETLGAGGCVEFRPWTSQAELAALYRTAHVVLVPSSATTTWVEQFGRTIVEAQASGAVVAGYASGAIPEVAGANGLLVPPGDAERLAGAVLDVVSDAGAFERRREAGLHAAAALTWRRIAARQADLYRAAHEQAQPRLQQPPSPRRRRAGARHEFGPPATTSAGDRPFALPVLRRGGPAVAGAAAVVDLAAEVAARLRG